MNQLAYNSSAESQPDQRYVHLSRNVIKTHGHIEKLLEVMGVSTEDPSYAYRKKKLYDALVRQFSSKTSKGGLNKKETNIQLHSDGSYHFTAMPVGQKIILQQNHVKHVPVADVTPAVSKNLDVVVSSEQEMRKQEQLLPMGYPKQAKQELSEEEILASWAQYHKELGARRSRHRMRRLRRRVAALVTTVGIAALAFIGLTKKDTPQSWTKVSTTVIEDNPVTATSEHTMADASLVKFSHDAKPAASSTKAPVAPAPSSPVAPSAAQPLSKAEAFDQAFAEARRGFCATFEHGGKIYTVDKEDEIWDWNENATLVDYIKAGAPHRPARYKDCPQP